MKNKNNLAIDKAVNDLIEGNLIPNNQAFDIDEHHLYCYTKLYQLHSKTSNGKFNRTYARKLAGLELIKLKRNWGLKPHQFKEGFIYCIKNNAWPEYTKIGITFDLKSRLSSYQTADPHRSFKISNYEFVLDRALVEKEVLQKFGVDLDNGEWLKLEDSTKVIQYVRSTISCWPEAN